MDPASVSRLARSCTSVNYRPIYFLAGATEESLADPNLDGTGVGLVVPVWFDEALPAIAEFRETLAQYAPGLEPDSNSVAGWVSAKLFEAATVHLAAPTSEAILEGLWAIAGNDLGGLTYPLTFTREQTAPEVVCWWLAAIREGEFATPNGGARHCA
jgi:hypothetical protein